MCTISQNTSERRRPLLRNLHTCTSFTDFLNQLHNMEPRGVPGLYELFQKDFPTDLKRAELSWIKVMSSPCAKFKCNKKINHQECFSASSLPSSLYQSLCVSTIANYRKKRACCSLPSCWGTEHTDTLLTTASIVCLCSMINRTTRSIWVIKVLFKREHVKYLSRCKYQK